MEQTTRIQIKDAGQAARVLPFIQTQLIEAHNLVGYCVNSLGNVGDPNDDYLELENKLEKVLYETRALGRPPPITPVKTDFDIIKPISRGTFGTVNLVRYKATRKIFAMKQIKVRYPEQREEVTMERDILASLDFPLVVSMCCSFETTAHLYMVMEFVGGGDCSSLLECKHHLPEDLSRFYMAEVVLAVEYIHSYGIIHRDLKPSNLLISSTGHIKVADFGLCKTGSVNISSCLTEKDCQKVAREFTDGECCGTPLYMPPEVFLKTGYGKPVDWWATGVILYNFLVGDDPFTFDFDFNIGRPVIRDNIPRSGVENLLHGDAQDLVSLLLRKDCVKRLGTRGAKEVRQHRFFRDVDWSSLPFETSPCVPNLEDEEDTSCFRACSPPVSKAVSQPSSTPVQTDFCCVAFNFNKIWNGPRKDDPVVEEDSDSKSFVSVESVDDDNRSVIEDNSDSDGKSFVSAESCQDVDDCVDDVFTGVDDTTPTLNPPLVPKPVMNTMNPVVMMNPVRRAMHPLLAINQLRLNQLCSFRSSAESSHP